MYCLLETKTPTWSEKEYSEPKLKYNYIGTLSSGVGTLIWYCVTFLIYITIPIRIWFKNGRGARGDRLKYQATHKPLFLMPNFLMKKWSYKYFTQLCTQLEKLNKYILNQEFSYMKCQDHTIFIKQTLIIGKNRIVVIPRSFGVINPVDNFGSK